MRIFSSLNRITFWIFHKIFEDRRVLRSTIFPHFAQSTKYKNILFVGCKWYTFSYNIIFRNKNYWTLEKNPQRRKYGAENHICASMEEIHQHFKENSLDLIVCNGVFGWGLDSTSSVEKAFSNSYESLRVGGILIIGWNDIPKRRPFPLDECLALRSFNSYIFPPLDESVYKTNTQNKHQYNFYIKTKHAQDLMK